MFSSATKSAAQGGSYNLTKSLRIRGNAGANLTRTFAAGNQTTWTWSGWVKRGRLGGSGSVIFNAPVTGQAQSFSFNGSDQIDFSSYNGGYQFTKITTSVYRDPAAWYHLVFVFDSTNVTASDRQRIYVNGVRLTSFGTNIDPSLNYAGRINSAVLHEIGNDASNNQFDGYIAEQYFIDGQALTPASFGSTNAKTGVWQPARYTGTYGTNGFYLSFTNTASTTTLGYDTSGNSNNWTCNNISLTSGVTYDSMNDVPTLTSATAANYPVINNIFLGSYGGTMTPYAGNLQTGTVQANADNNVLGSMGMPSTGKYYWEVTITGGAASPSGGIGYYLGVSDAIGQYSFGWQSKSGSPFSTTYTTNDVLGFASNKDAGTIECFKNGVSVGSTSLADSYKFFIFYYWGNDGTGAAIAVNFGQQPFKYSVPSGFKALNSYNLPDSTILAGNKYMDASLYTGNSSTQTITNSGAFKPDMVWTKARSAAYNNLINDSVRGSTKLLIVNGIDVEQTEAQSITSFNSNGYSLGTAGSWNNNAQTYVGWQWQAGQGTTSSNTAGSITSTVSVNPTAGFSIVTYTGNGSNPQTIGHGLGVTPALIIVKTRSGGTGSWITYHQSLGANYYLILDGNAAASADSQAWNNTAPTSSVFTIGKYCNWANGWDYVAYCWAQIDGFSKFGSYGGTGDTTYNSFQYCGFRPKFLMWKCSSNGANDWNIIDTSRDTYNAAAKYLRPDSTIAEQNDGPLFDILSNGFKPRTFFSDTNRSGYTYVYAAFAENPFKNALAR